MSPFTAFDESCMRRALALAERGLYTTTPNPRVGCVIVAGGSVIGEGWHERAGLPQETRYIMPQPAQSSK